MKKKKLVKLVNDFPNGHVTKNKIYPVTEEDKTYYCIINDRGEERYFYKNRFVEVEEDNNIDDLMGYPRIVEYYEVIKKVPLSGYKLGTKLHETKSFDEYAQYPEFFKPHYKAQYKAGDWVTAHAESKLGSKTFQVVHVDSTHVWNGDPSNSNPIGYGLQNVRHATAEEIEAASAITIAGYKMQKDGTDVSFGCKRFNRGQIIHAILLIQSGLKITYNNEEITEDKLNKILQNT